MTLSRSAKRAFAILTLLCTCTLPAAASVDPALVARLHGAAQSILAPGAGDAARPPRLTDPAAKAAFAAWEGTAEPARTSFVAKDIDAVMAIGEDLVRLIHHYIDAKGADGRIDGPANILAYEDELAVLMSAQIDITIAQIEAGVPFLKALPPREVTRIRLEGFAKLKLTVVEMLRGVLCFVGAPELKDDNRRRIASALSRNAAAVGRHLDPAAIASLQETAETTARQASAAPLRDNLLAFARAPRRASDDQAR